MLAVAAASVESTYITGSTLRLDSIDQLELIFDRGTNTGSNAGAWQRDLSGSTGSGGTGPAENSLGPYVYSETSGSDYGAVADVSTITILENVMSGWSGSGRQIVIRANIAGSGWTLDSEGLQIQGKSASDTEWSTIEIIQGWAFSSSYDFGDTITDSAGDDHSCIQIGGWVDFTIDVPNDHTEVRFRNLALDGPGSVWQHDLALWQIALQEGTAVDLTPAAPTIPDQTGTVGTEFSYTLPPATGGDDPVTTTADQLPAGLSLTSGVISGTPTAAGTTTVTITYTDDDGDTDTAAFDITVAAAPALTATANASLEVEFSATAPAMLGDAPPQPALAATANASFEVDFSADAPATIVVSAALTGLSLFDFENLPDGLLAWFAETDPYSQTNVGARVVDEGGESTQALSPIVPEFVVGGGNAYVVTLLFFFDGQLWLELHTSPTSSGSGSGPQLTDYAEANFVLAIETDTGNTYSWRVGDLILSDDSEPYRWSASSVATAGPALTDAIRTGIINSSSVKSILFDSTSSQIDAANLRTNTTSPLAATADASFEVDFAAAAAATLSAADPLSASANASLDVDLSVAAPASLGDVPTQPPLAAAANASFEVEFSAAAAASLGSAPEALSFSDWATYAPAGREARLLMLALRGTTHWYWPAQDSSGQLLDTSNSLYDDDLTDDLKINRIRWVDGDFTLNRSGAGSFDTYFEGATPPLDDGIWHIITDDGEITLGSALLDDAGGGFARWMPTDTADIAFIDGIDAGDRFLLAFTMPGTPVTALAATADASFEVDLAAAAPATLGAAPVHTPLAATANAILKSTLRQRRRQRWAMRRRSPPWRLRLQRHSR